MEIIKYSKILLDDLTKVNKIVGKRTLASYIKAMLINVFEILRQKSLTPADKAMIGKTYSFKVDGHLILLDGSLFGLAREIYCKKVYFTIPGFSINMNDIVVDLGANAGVFTVMAALSAKRVVAVEAQSGFIKEMENNLILNKCLNKVSIVFGIIGADTGVFSDIKRLKVASHFGNAPPRTSFSELINRFDLEKINFLKIDIEGSEFALFNENTTWLSIVDKIAMEVHPEFGDIKSLGDILKNNGFRVWYVDKNQKIVSSLSSIGYLFARRLI